MNENKYYSLIVEYRKRLIEDISKVTGTLEEISKNLSGLSDIKLSTKEENAN